MQRSKRNRTSGWKRRVAKACDTCRSKKAKCDGSRPTCTRCSRSRLVCIYADSGNNLISQRSTPSLGTVCDKQSVTENFGRAIDLNDSSTVSSSSRSSQIAGTKHCRNVEPVELPFNVDVSKGKKELMLVGKREDQHRYYGPSSFVSILSPCGLSWIESHVNEPSSRRLRELVLRGDTVPLSIIDTNLQQSFYKESSVPLPPLPEALALIQEFLDEYNHVMPIFHPPTVVTMLGQHYSEYSRKAGTNSAWWVSLNAMLAIAQRRRVETKNYPPEDMKKVWGYMRNVMDALLDVTLRGTSLGSIQALLTASLFFLGTPDPHTSFSLTGIAVRNSQIIGLNVAVTHPNLSPEQITQRKRVFWVAAILEQAASHRAGRSATLALQEREIDLPPENDVNGVGIVQSSDGSSEINLFRMMACIAVIESKAFHGLYSPRVPGRIEKDMTVMIEDLDKDLKAYREATPTIFYADRIENDSWFKAFSLEIYRTEIEYYYCVIIVHRIDGHRSHSFQTGSSTQDKDESRGHSKKSSNEECLKAARTIVKLIERVPRCIKSFFWISSYIPLAALVVLFINTLQRPLSTEVTSDIEAIDTIIRKTSDVDESDAPWLQAQLGIMIEFLRIARSAVEKASANAANTMRLQDDTAVRQTTFPTNHPGVAMINERDVRSSTHSFQGSRNSESTTTWYDGPARVSDPLITYTYNQTEYSTLDADQNNFTLNVPDSWYNDPGSTEWPTDVMSMSLPFPWSWQELSEIQAQT